MKFPLLLVVILMVVVGVVLYAYYRPTLEVSWFGTIVTLF